MANPIPAVGYARCSTDRQDTSVEDQIKAVTRYAEQHGYNILRWYVDDGISGDDTEHRLKFQKMIHDAKERADFAAILCWSQDRFGRFDQVEAGHWIYLLRQAGAYLVTCDLGRIDWDSPQGQLIFNVQQMGKHQFLKDHARHTTRGQIEAANNGSWLGCPPYAYKLEGPKKHKMLVVGDLGKVKVVQRIYREYVNELRSLREIASRLNRDGVPSPNKRGWCYNTVAEIIANPAYVGDYARERNTCGKYSTIRKAVVVKSDGKHKRPREEWTIQPNHHEALIDRDTYNAALAILNRGRQERSRCQKDREPALFTCRLRCGKCGALLYAVTGRRLYECSTLRRQGAAAATCPGTTVKEDTLLVSLAEHLENWLGLEGAELEVAAFYGWLTERDELPKVFHEVRNLIAPPPSTPRQDRNRLARYADKLKADIQKARGNLVLLDPENIPAAEARVKAMAEELKLAEEELARTKQPSAAEVNKAVEGVLHSLYSLAYCCRALTREHRENYVGSLEMAAPMAVRQLLAKIGHIVIHTAISGRGTRTRHKFERGEIVFRSGPEDGRGEALFPLPGRGTGPLRAGRRQPGRRAALPALDRRRGRAHRAAQLQPGGPDGTPRPD
jgi:DNA invertase Pin-like site-specific DNA recombinase